MLGGLREIDAQTLSFPLSVEDVFERGVVPKSDLLQLNESLAPLLHVELDLLLLRLPFMVVILGVRAWPSHFQIHENDETPVSNPSPN